MTRKGSCLCGAVTYQLTGEIPSSVACHCSQCRKTSGHYWSGTRVLDTQFEITRDTGLKWFQSSDRARRGFCQDCGSSLFWQMLGEGATSIGSGTLDDDSGLKTAKHIFVGDKGGITRLKTGRSSLSLV